MSARLRNYLESLVASRLLKRPGMSYDRKSEGVSGPAQSLRSAGRTPGKRTLVESLNVRPAPSAKSASKPRRTVSTQAATASLAAAQHCFDDAVHDVENGKHGEQGSAYIYEREGKAALAHFREVRNAIDRDDADRGDEKLLDQAIQTTLSFREFVYLWDDEAEFGDHRQRLQPMMDELIDERRHIAGSLVLTRDDEEGVRHKRTSTSAKSDDHYDGKAIGPAMELAGIEARDGYALLRNEQKGKENRWEIVQHTTVKIMDHLPYATNLLVHLDKKKNAAKHQDVVEKASQPMAEIDQWIQSRQGHATMLETYARVVDEIDTARGAVGLGSLGDLKTELHNSEKNEAIDEQKAMSQAKSHCESAISLLHDGEQHGIEVFEGTAGLKDPEVPKVDYGREIIESVVKGIIGVAGTALLGHAVTFIDEVAVASAAARLAMKIPADVRKELIKLAESATSDVLQATAGAMLTESKEAGLLAAQATDNERAKARAFYVAAVKRAASHRRHELAKWLGKVEGERSLMPIVVDVMAAAFELAEKSAMDRMLIESARGWAELVESLSIAARGGDRANYGGHYDGTKPDLMGTHGAVRIEWNIEENDEVDGETSSEYKMTKVEVNGMNDVILTALLEDADFEIGKIRATRELVFHKSLYYPTETHWGAMQIVIDPEHNLEWSNIIERPSGKKYDSRTKLWDYVKGKTIDRGFARTLDKVYAQHANDKAKKAK